MHPGNARPFRQTLLRPRPRRTAPEGRWSGVVREGELEAGAGWARRSVKEIAAVRTRIGLRDREPESGSLCPVTGGIAAREALEEMRDEVAATPSPRSSTARRNCRSVVVRPRGPEASRSGRRSSAGWRRSDRKPLDRRPSRAPDRSGARPRMRGPAASISTSSSTRRRTGKFNPEIEIVRLETREVEELVDQASEPVGLLVERGAEMWSCSASRRSPRRWSVEAMPCTTAAGVRSSWEASAMKFRATRSRSRARDLEGSLEERAAERADRRHEIEGALVEVEGSPTAVGGEEAEAAPFGARAPPRSSRHRTAP